MWILSSVIIKSSNWKPTRFEEWKLDKMYPARLLETSISDLEKGRKGTNFEDEIEPLWEGKIVENL